MTVSPQPGNQDERRCVCGDTLGQHDVDGDRQCLAGDPDNPWECDCSEFRAAAAAGQTGAGEEADAPTEPAPDLDLPNVIPTQVDPAPSAGHVHVHVDDYDGVVDCDCSAPSAGQDTGQMRDEIAESARVWLYERAYAELPVTPGELADRFLALPALVRLIAERDDLRRELDQAHAQAQRVEALAEHWSTNAAAAKGLTAKLAAYVAANELRNALGRS